MPLTVAPQFFGNARVAYDFQDNWPTVALAMSFVGPRLADRALDGGFPVLPVAPMNVQTRFTVSGVIPKVSGLSYRLVGNVASASVNPYLAGPNQSVGPDNAPAELSPINRLTVFGTLNYDLSP